MPHEQVDTARYGGEQGHPTHACPDDDQPDYGGAFDGVGAVHSDADPGL
jgi:hypothetical protein